MKGDCNRCHRPQAAYLIEEVRYCSSCYQTLLVRERDHYKKALEWAVEKLEQEPFSSHKDEIITYISIFNIEEFKELLLALKPFAMIIKESGGRMPTEKLLSSDWKRLGKSLAVLEKMEIKDYKHQSKEWKVDK